MNIKIYGTRGGIPTPSREGFSTAVFGGNTTCVYIESSDGTKHIIDAGSGIHVLGNELVEKGFDGTQHACANLYISHTHWDHIQGLPFFKPAYHKGNDIRVYGEAKIEVVCGDGRPENLKAHSDLQKVMSTQSGVYAKRMLGLMQVNGEGIRDVLADQQNERNFPVSLEVLCGLTRYYDFRPEFGPLYETDTFMVEAMQVNHPGGCISYKFTEKRMGGKSTIVVNTDFEPDPAYDGRMIEWWKDADIVIADGQYEPPGMNGTSNPFKKGWGHSNYRDDIDLASAAGVRKLFLTHHDPNMNDRYHSDLEERAKVYASVNAPELSVMLAREGTEFET